MQTVSIETRYPDHVVAAWKEGMIRALTIRLGSYEKAFLTFHEIVNMGYTFEITQQENWWLRFVMLRKNLGSTEKAFRVFKHIVPLGYSFENSFEAYYWTIFVLLAEKISIEYAFGRFQELAQEGFGDPTSLDKNEPVSCFDKWNDAPSQL